MMISTLAAVLSSIFLILIFPFSLAFEDNIDQTGGGGSIGDFIDDQGVFVQLTDLGPDPDFASPIPVVVGLNINDSSSLKVRIELEFFSFEVLDTGVEELHKVVREYFGRKAHGNPLRPLGQQQRELDRANERVLFSSRHRRVANR